MKEIKWILNTGFAGCEHKGIVKVEDDATEDEIDDIVKEEAFRHINWCWIEGEIEK